MVRKVSWLLGALAYGGSPLWAFREQAALRAQAEAAGTYLCGLPMLAIIGIACLSMAALSGGAVVLGWVSFRRLPKPRPRVRAAELVVLAIPMVVGLGYFGLLFSA
jgi:hypothetical protein